MNAERTSLSMNKLSISQSEIIVDIRKNARRLNHSPSYVEYKRYGRYDVRTVQRKA
jgi:Homing endonuclease associated repeat